DLYGPDGALIETQPTQAPGGGSRDELISRRLTASGTYTVVVSETHFYLSTSVSTPDTYALNFARAPGEIQTSPGDEGGPLINGTKSNGTIDIGDLDVWSFTANSGDSIQLRVGGDNLVPQIDLYGPD